MTEIAKATARSDIDRFQASLLKLPQAQGIRTDHYFADGMYCRTVWRPAGCAIVGKVHKKEHFYVVLQGEVTVTSVGEIPQRIKGPKVLVSAVGTKRAVYAHVDSMCMTVHRIDGDSSDLEKIEEELVEPDEAALFGIGNQPISLVRK